METLGLLFYLYFKKGEKMKNKDSIYHGKDGRLRVYVKETKKTISYPKYLMEKELGRALLPNEAVHHIDDL